MLIKFSQSWLDLVCDPFRVRNHSLNHDHILNICIKKSLVDPHAKDLSARYSDKKAWKLNFVWLLFFLVRSTQHFQLSNKVAIVSFRIIFELALTDYSTENLRWILPYLIVSDGNLCLSQKFIRHDNIGYNINNPCWSECLHIQGVYSPHSEYFNPFFAK